MLKLAVLLVLVTGLAHVPWVSTNVLSSVSAHGVGQMAWSTVCGIVLTALVTAWATPKVLAPLVYTVTLTALVLAAAIGAVSLWWHFGQHVPVSVDYVVQATAKWAQSISAGASAFVVETRYYYELAMQHAAQLQRQQQQK